MNRLHVYFRNHDHVGTLYQDIRTGGIFFQYENAWIDRGLELSPFHLPIANRALQSNPDPLFNGLPGVFWDSMPDVWGNQILDLRLEREGLDPQSASPLVRLGYIADRSVGALNYKPEFGGKSDLWVVDLALMDREAFQLNGDADGDAESLLPLIEGGTSAGGAHPKICVRYESETGKISIGAKGKGEPWLIKLSALPPSNKDSRQSGLVEFAFADMARASGIEMPETRVFESATVEGKKRWYFAVKRFDQVNGEKIHTHSYAGLIQKHHSANNHSYEELMSVTWELTGRVEERDKVFRRMLFNFLAGNCDDHARNWAFLMDDKGEWRLSPAYDLNPSPGINQSRLHALTVYGERNPERQSLEMFAKNAGVSDWKTVWAEVEHGIRQWDAIACSLSIRDAVIQRVKQGFRLNEWHSEPVRDGIMKSTKGPIDSTPHKT